MSRARFSPQIRPVLTVSALQDTPWSQSQIDAEQLSRSRADHVLSAASTDASIKTAALALALLICSPLTIGSWVSFIVALPVVAVAMWQVRLQCELPDGSQVAYPEMADWMGARLNALRPLGRSGDAERLEKLIGADQRVADYVRRVRDEQQREIVVEELRVLELIALDTERVVDQLRLVRNAGGKCWAYGCFEPKAA